MSDVGKTMLETQNERGFKAEMNTSTLEMKDHGGKDSSISANPPEEDLLDQDAKDKPNLTRICDEDETVSENHNDPQNEEIDTKLLDVMQDYVDKDSSNPSSPNEDPFNQYDTESNDSEKPRRKKLTLASHITVIEDSSPVCYCCTVCKSYFSHKHTARNHEFCGTSEKPFKCKLCEKRFVKRSDRENHYKTHTGETSFVCSVCDKSFYLKHKLNRHIRSHTGIKGDFQCSACSRSFICREALRKHQVNKHNPNRRIQCENCGKLFERTEERQKHKCAHPPKKKKLVCEVCGKTFTKNWNLTVHLRIHVGQRPFKCSTCNKNFRLRQHLERHSTKHQADADFECMLCKQTFGRKDNMIRHLKLNHPDRHLGVDIKDMVQRSEKAQIAKSKKLFDERAVDKPEASTEATAPKTLTVLPVDNLPNIRFAKMPSESSTAPESLKHKVESLDPSILKKSSFPGTSTQKLFETRIEKSVVLQTVIRSESTVLRSVETRRFVQSTVVERVDPFKSRNTVNQATEHSCKPQPSVLVFNKSQISSAEHEHAGLCASPPASAPEGSLDQTNNFGNQIELQEARSVRNQQVSVLRFSSRDPNTRCQR